MKTKSELIEFFGLSDRPEILDENDNIIAPASSPSENYNFYAIDVKDISGNPIEAASSSCSADCMAAVIDDVLYIATSGQSTLGSKV